MAAVATESHSYPRVPAFVLRSDSAETLAARLATRIRERIFARLGSRIHDLDVRIHEKTVTLEGRCATYHSKQLAQHAALGVLEDEHLDNKIAVTHS